MVKKYIPILIDAYNPCLLCCYLTDCALMGVCLGWTPVDQGVRALAARDGGPVPPVDDEYEGFLHV